MFDVGLDYVINVYDVVFFFLIIRQQPRSKQSGSSAASEGYKRQALNVSVHVRSKGKSVVKRVVIVRAVSIQGL